MLAPTKAAANVSAERNTWRGIRELVRIQFQARLVTVDANEKPYKCQVENCDADFTRSDLLKRYLIASIAPTNLQARRNQTSAADAARIQS